MEDIDDDSDNPVYARSLYMDIERYRLFILKKYGKYLDAKYLNILLTKISLIEHELKTKMLYSMYEPEYELENSRRR